MGLLRLRLSKETAAMRLLILPFPTACSLTLRTWCERYGGSLALMNLSACTNQVDVNETLGLLAQLSIAVTGFSGIAGAFRRTDQSWSQWDRINLGLVLLLSLIACGLSVIPLLLGSFPNRWLISAGMFCGAWGAVSIYWWRLARGVPDPRGPWPLTGLVYVSALISVLASVKTECETLYPLGVAMLLGLAASLFFAFTTFFSPATQQDAVKAIRKPRAHHARPLRTPRNPSWLGALLIVVAAIDFLVFRRAGSGLPNSPSDKVRRTPL